MLFDYVQAGMVLNEDITDDRGNLLLESGTTLTDSYLTRLKSLGFRQLKVFDPYAASIRPKPVLPDSMHEDLVACLKSIMTIRLEQTQNANIRYMYIRKLDSTIKNLIAHLETHIPDSINASVRMPSESEISHSVNVCLMSVLTGLYLRFPTIVMSDLAIGSLLHDIGKTAFPENTPADNAFNHTLYGRDLLLAYKLNPTVARVAAEHHERPDGAGYPLGLLGKDIHPLSRIVAIANFYDLALSLEQKNQLTRQEITERMMASGNTSFDLNMLRAFFQTIAVYPVGSLVKLNSGKLAYVLKNKTRMPLRPCVEIADSTQQEIDLAFHPGITIEQLIAE